jgi:2-polyprenyl-3-methyl-5-hydroxy-6-metoxy-1,4-benzoquinol methylase
MSSQQEQTKSFFKAHAIDWQEKAEDSVYSVINDRHRAVHKTLDRYPVGSSLLDVGCGTGQLAIEAVSKGFEAIGIDFADEMISIARKNATDSGSTASFVAGSIFDYQPSQKFNVISAMGFIEYISLKQLSDLFDYFFEHLADGGSISIGSRNRLFNLTTFNDYTEMEHNIGAIEPLIKEAGIALTSSQNAEYLERLRSYSKEVEFVQNESHPITGIGVETRYQFTPSDLLSKAEQAGFEVTNIFSVNYHAINPSIEDERILSIRKDIAELISAEYQSEFRFLPNSSSFVMEAKKCP